MSNIVDPNSINLVLSGQSAFGSGGGMPSEGVHGVVVTEASIRRNERGLSLWLTLTTDGGHKLYDYVSLPTAQNAQEKTKYGTKAEFFEKKLKATLLSLEGHNPAGIKALTGTDYSGQHLLDWTLNRRGNVFYRPPMAGGKHQIDYISQGMVEKVRSGEVTFQDRRRGGGATSSLGIPSAAPVAAVPSNGVHTPQPPGGDNVVSNLITGGIL